MTVMNGLLAHPFSHEKGWAKRPFMTCFPSLPLLSPILTLPYPLIGRIGTFWPILTPFEPVWTHSYPFLTTLNTSGLQRTYFWGHFGVQVPTTLTNVSYGVIYRSLIPKKKNATHGCIACSLSQGRGRRPEGRPLHGL